MRTIRHFVDRQARERPDDTFMIAPEAGLTLTYGQLREDSVALGRRLTDLGMSKGDKLSYMLSNGYQTTKILLGGMYSGFVLAPLNLMVQPSHLEHVLEHSDTKLVFFTEDQREKLESAAARVKRHIELIQIDNDAEALFPAVADVTVADVTVADVTVADVTVADVAGKDVAGKDSSDMDITEVDEEDDALLLYTSGTTGMPKGVMLSHKNVVSGGEYTVTAHELGPEDRALCSLPVYHINGAIVTVVAPLLSGGSVIMPHRFAVSTFWRLLSDYRCTWFSVVPTIISYLNSATDIKGENLDLTNIRFGRSASSALPQALHKAFEEKFNVSVIETLGLTETAAPVFSNPLEPTKRKYGSPGRPVGNEARIADKDGAEAPRGTQGEIMTRGDNVMKGYYKAPDLTAKAIEPDGWLHTGDVGYMDEDGFVFVTGRIKEIIIKGGENIAPREIDEALYSHPAVLDCAAVGVPDEHYGEEIMCGVVLKPGCEATEEELRSHCLPLLGEFKTPKAIKFLDDLPKGPSGKIQRMRLREKMR